jgi:hypothetical protein
MSDVRKTSGFCPLASNICILISVSHRIFARPLHDSHATNCLFTHWNPVFLPLDSSASSGYFVGQTCTLLPAAFKSILSFADRFGTARMQVQVEDMAFPARHGVSGHTDP